MCSSDIARHSCLAIVYSKVVLFFTLSEGEHLGPHFQDLVKGVALLVVVHNVEVAVGLEHPEASDDVFVFDQFEDLG